MDVPEQTKSLAEDISVLALRQRLSALTKEELIELVISQQLQIASLQGVIDQLTVRVSELEKKQGNGDPPPFVKPNVLLKQRKENEKAKRKPRPEAFVRKRLEPTDVVYHALSHCPDCDRVLKDGWEQRRRQVIELPPVTVKVTDHVVIARHCCVCGKDVVPDLDLSGEVVGQHSLGVSMMSLIGCLRSVCRLPVRSIRSLLKTLYGLRVGSGTIVGALDAIAAKGETTLQKMLKQIRCSSVVHADETGWREDGQNGYLWSFSTPNLRYLVYNKSRSGQVGEDALGSDFDNVVVTDFYAAYNRLNCRHQRCWVHLLRALHELKEKHKDNTETVKWADSVIALYREAIEYRKACDKAPAADVYGPLARIDKRREFESRLAWLAAPYLDLPKQQRPPQTVLAERCERFCAEMFLFVQLLNVPSENNAAERSIRPCVIARKISGGTRSAKGSKTQMALMSLFATWQLQGHNPMDQCRIMLTGKEPA